MSAILEHREAIQTLVSYSWEARDPAWVARKLIIETGLACVLPAPILLRGLADAWAQAHHASGLSVDRTLALVEREPGPVPSGDEGLVYLGLEAARMAQALLHVVRDQSVESNYVFHFAARSVLLGMHAVASENAISFAECWRLP